jgi:hypothetical protein
MKCIGLLMNSNNTGQAKNPKYQPGKQNFGIRMTTWSESFGVEIYIGYVIIFVREDSWSMIFPGDMRRSISLTFEIHRLIEKTVEELNLCSNSW